MPRIVLDPDIVVTGLLSASGASHAILREIALGRLTPLLTPVLFHECEAALKRPEQRLKLRLGLGDVDHFLAGLASACEEVDVNCLWRPRLSDPIDEIVLKTAVTGGADALVTLNVREYARSTAWYRLPILKPGEVLRELAS